MSAGPYLDIHVIPGLDTALQNISISIRLYLFYLQRCIKNNPDWFYVGKSTQNIAHAAARCIVDSVSDPLK